MRVAVDTNRRGFTQVECAPETVTGEDTWRDWAACWDMDPDDFFPRHTDGTMTPARRYDATAAVCAGCTVRARCLGAELAAEPRKLWHYGRACLTSIERRVIILDKLTVRIGVYLVTWRGRVSLAPGEVEPDRGPKLRRSKVDA